jgi:hypothetical protein
MPTTHHTGFAGEAAVASEFSVRGYIVSLPMVDLGTDLFIENHTTGRDWRVQVKTSLGVTAQPNYFQFTIKETAIHAPAATADHFAFVVRIDGAWRIYMVPQQVLSTYVNNNAMGSLNGVNRVFTFIRDPANGRMRCSGTDMTSFGGPTSWDAWPAI